MSLILSGTDGLSDVDGSAATPAIRGTDANTGIFFPAADTIAFSEGGTEAMRVTSAGNVGIGIPSNSGQGKLQVFQALGGTIDSAIRVTDDSTSSLFLNNISSGVSGIWASGALTFGTSSNTNTERMRIDSSGNVGIGTASPGALLHVSNGDAKVRIGLTASSQYTDIYRDSGTGYTIYNAAQAASFRGHIWQLGGTEAARINSSGNLLVGTTTAYNNSNTFFVTSGANLPALTAFKNSAAGSSDNAFCVMNGAGGGTNSFIVLASGNALNTNNSYGAISDVRLKENIQDATPKLADLMQVKIRQYNLIADEEKQKQLGVIADELQAVFPAMVTEGNDGFKNVKYSVFVPMLIKAIQEQQALITQLQADVAALKAQP